MARRRTKKRTQVKVQNKSAHNSHGAASAGERIPKSMVLRIGAGEVGPSVSQLVKDVRAMMEPNTASRLKERRSNRLKDYTTMAGPLGVTHLLLFSRSTSGNTNLRIALAPRGPTFFFKVESYSLCKDIQRSMKHAKTAGKECLTPPLLVMNNFLTPPSAPGTSSTTPAVPKHLETLTTSMFQSLFPSISPQDTSLSSLHRVLLLNREPTTTATGPHSSSSARPDDQEVAGSDGGSYIINLRHYAISTKPTGISKRVRRLRATDRLIHSREAHKRGLPNLGRLEDMADYFLDPVSGAGFTSASESEVETDAEVEVVDTRAKHISTIRNSSMPAGVDPSQGSTTDANNATAATVEGDHGRSKSKDGTVERRVVKLDELGPRMRLRLIKVEEGLCGGKVMWHEHVTKTLDESHRLDLLWHERRRLKEERRKVQLENVERKQTHLLRPHDQSTKETCEENGNQEQLDEFSDDGDDMDDWDGLDQDVVT